MIQIVLRLGGGLVGRDTVRSLAAVLCRNTGATWPGEAPRYGAGTCDTSRRVRGGRGDTMRDMTGQACDTAGAGPAIQRCARCLGAPCVQPGSVGCAPMHPT